MNRGQCQGLAQGLVQGHAQGHDQGLGQGHAMEGAEKLYEGIKLFFTIRFNI